MIPTTTPTPSQHTSMHDPMHHQAPFVLPAIPPRDPRGHKGTFGSVAVIGGCAAGAITMIGAPTLTAIAALRAGAGIARLHMPQPLVAAALTIAPSCTACAIPTDSVGQYTPSDAAAAVDFAAESTRVLAVGPGLGAGPGPTAITLRAIQQREHHVVLDADALNALCEIPDLHRDFHAPAVLTPHPGEFRRLAAALNVHDDPINPASRPVAATALAQRLGCIVVLKGANTIVTDGLRTYIDPAHDSALATAGTGDVLTGIIAGLVAQHVAPPIDDLKALAHARSLAAGHASAHVTGNLVAEEFNPIERLDLFTTACLAVRTHAIAARIWRARHNADAGLLALELAECIPAAVQSLRHPA